MNVTDVLKQATTQGITYETLIAYIDGLHADGSLSDEDYNKIILYILANGNLENSPRDLIQIYRGNFIDLPNLAQGELGWCLDTKQLFIGGIDGNTEITNAYSSLNWLRGKTINVFGDSISAQSFSWPNQFPPDLKITVHNFSKDGMGISGDGGWNTLINTINSPADINIVFCGVNDYRNQIPTGNIFSVANDNFAGSCNILFSAIQGKWPNALNYCFLPLRSNAADDNTRTIPLEFYCSILSQSANYYGIPCLDLYRFAPNFNPGVSFLKTRWAPDGLHPSESYHYLFLAPYIAHSLNAQSASMPMSTTNLIPGFITKTGVTITNLIQSFSYDTSGHIVFNAQLSLDTSTITLNAPSVIGNINPSFLPTVTLCLQCVTLNGSFITAPAYISPNGEVSVCYPTLVGDDPNRTLFISATWYCSNNTHVN